MLKYVKIFKSLILRCLCF